jgi:Na+-driven multidrug efflux pump
MSAINSFGDVFVAANSAFSNIEAIIFQGLNATFTACTSFSGQNYGAKNLKRIDKLFGAGILLCTAVSGVMVLGVALFPSFFLGLFTSDLEVIQTGIPRLLIVGIGYLIYIPAEISVGCTRGMGKSVVPMLLNIFCVVLCRIFWILFVFPLYNTYISLLLCYPLSWILVSSFQTVCYFIYRNREGKRFAALAEKEIPAVQ